MRKALLELRLHAENKGFSLRVGERVVLRHTPLCPALVMACGDPKVLMYRGNFTISDAPSTEIAPTGWRETETGIELLHQDRPVARLTLADNAISAEALLPGYDRLHLRFHAEPGECVWGGGEQMSYLTLNGRKFPIWTSEPGVGRDKSTELDRKSVV